MLREEAVLIDTPVGLLGGVVTVPDGPPIAASLVLQGQWGTRFGTNRLWARTARTFAELGMVTLRIDYPGLWESGPGPKSKERALEGVRASAQWLRQRTGTDLYIVGFCFGAWLAVQLASADPGIRGLALVDLRLRKTGQCDSGPRSVPGVIRPSLSAMRTVYLRARGRKVHPGRRVQPLDSELVRSLSLLAPRIPAWVLLGHRQDRAADFTAAGDALRLVAVEIAPGLHLHSLATPLEQEELLRRLGAWAEQTLRSRVLA